MCLFFFPGDYLILKSLIFTTPLAPKNADISIQSCVFCMIFLRNLTACTCKKNKKKYIYIYIYSGHIFTYLHTHTHRLVWNKKNDGFQQKSSFPGADFQVPS